MSEHRATPLTLMMGATLVVGGLFCLFGAVFPARFLSLFVGAQRAAGIDFPARLLGMFGALMVPMGAVIFWFGLPSRMKRRSGR